MPVIGPDTNLFIVSLSRVKSSLPGSPLRIRPWVSWDLISQRTTGMADGKDLLGHPVHMPRQEKDEIVSLVHSQVPRLDLNNSSNKTVIARKFHCLLVLLQNRLLKALDVLLLILPELHHKWEKSGSIKCDLGQLNLSDDLKIELEHLSWWNGFCADLLQDRINILGYLNFAFFYINVLGLLQCKANFQCL